MLPPAHLRKVVEWARERGTVVAADECYLSLAGDTEPVSILHPDVCGGSHEGLLAVHSLSKSSNLAGYRAGFVAGDPALVAALLEVRKHAGMIMPFPVQAAMTAAASDDAHVAVQTGLYDARRALLRPAVEKAGLTVEHSEAGSVPLGHGGRAGPVDGAAPGRRRCTGGTRGVLRSGGRAARAHRAHRVRRADRDGSPAPRPAVTRAGGTRPVRAARGAAAPEGTGAAPAGAPRGDAAPAGDGAAPPGGPSRPRERGAT